MFYSFRLMNITTGNVNRDRMTGCIFSNYKKEVYVDQRINTNTLILRNDGCNLSPKTTSQRGFFLRPKLFMNYIYTNTFTKRPPTDKACGGSLGRPSSTSATTAGASSATCTGGASTTAV